MHRRTNYLRTCRKRCGLSQDDVAFVLGAHAGSKVSRYELQRRLPPLSTVFALEILYHVPAEELFAGLHDGVERVTLARIARLERRVEHTHPGRLRDHKLTVLRACRQRHRTIRP